MNVMRRAVLWAICTFALAMGYALWPVCVPLSPEQVAASQPPLEQRSERALFGPVFQQRGGQWCQCKTRIARAFFA
jgi:hypothetical protein